MSHLQKKTLFMLIIEHKIYMFLFLVVEAYQTWIGIDIIRGYLIKI